MSIEIFNAKERNATEFGVIFQNGEAKLGTWDAETKTIKPLEEPAKITDSDPIKYFRFADDDMDSDIDSEDEDDIDSEAENPIKKSTY